MVYVLPSEVDDLVGDWPQSGSPLASTLLKPMSEPIGIIGFSGRTLLGRSKGKVGMIGRMATIVSSSGLTRTVSFQPSSVGIRRDDDVVPADPVQHLHVVEVPVDGVGVHAVVGDLPDLRAVVATEIGVYV